MKTFNFLILGFLFIGIIVISSCKEDLPYAKITVIDELKKPVSGVQVKIYAPAGRFEEIILVTNSAGIAEYEFDTEYLLQVTATLFDDTGLIPLKTGTGVLRLQKDVVYEETITIRP